MEMVDQVRRRFTNAWTVLFGAHGEITRQAELAGQSRQALYRDAQVVLETLDGSRAQQHLEQLERRLGEQAARIDRLQADRQRLVEINADLQAGFASTAQAEGVSLPVARRLLAIFLGAKTPSVATLGRLSRDAARRSAGLLEVLDQAAAPKLEHAAADEIFSARPPS